MLELGPDDSQHRSVNRSVVSDGMVPACEPRVETNWDLTERERGRDDGDR